MKDSSLVETSCVKYTEGLFHYTDLRLDNAAFSGVDNAVLTVYSYQEECLTGIVEITYVHAAIPRLQG